MSDWSMRIGACYSTVYIILNELIICISCRSGGQNLCGQRPVDWALSMDVHYMYEIFLNLGLQLNS